MTTIGNLHEHDANQVIAQWLDAANPDWNATGERGSTLVSDPGRPDIVIRQGSRMPVIVECEYRKPAVDDAQKRLGKQLQGETRKFTEVIAVGIDDRCKRDSVETFRKRLDDNEPIFTVQIVSEKDGVNIWPNNPLPAKPTDLVAYCEYSQVPQAVIEEQSENIAQQVSSIARKLHESIRLTGNLQDDTFNNLCEIVGCQNSEDATRTACAIWLIAIDLQNDLATHSKALQDAELLTTQSLTVAANGLLLQSDILHSWRIIESVNYLPVMELAIASLEAGNLGGSIVDVLQSLERLSQQLNGLHAKHIYNFAGELWQRLVSDREERAAHYTKPEIAELLATAAAERFGGLSAAEIAKVNILDAACGTGTLIGAGERAIRRKHAAAGGSDAELHRKRMEEHIYAMDVNGIAGTLTAKRLTDMNVEQDYRKSKIAVITHEAGSLTLLNPEMTGISNVLGYRNVTPTTGIGGGQDFGVFHVGLGGIHWALMNPPYSRPRKGRQQATKGLDPLRRAARKGKWLMSHGSSIATDFGNVSNIRLSKSGVFAHVLPLTAAHAKSWQSWRTELEKDFQDIVAITNVAASELQSMSADTGMGEMLVIATKRDGVRPSEWQETDLLCVNLHMAPRTLAEGYALAREITGIPQDASFGLLTDGSYIRTPQVKAGEPWGAVGNSNNELTAVSMELLNGKAYDPLSLTTRELALPMATLGRFAETGPTHHLIGHPKGSEPIGAFEWTPLEELSVAPSQQSMWAANGKTQTGIFTQPTHGGAIVDNDLAKQMVSERSQWHISRNLRWTSQAVASVKTAIPTHGGRAWNALQEMSDNIGQCTALFYNSVFGGIVRNSYGQSTQSGRATIQVNAIPGLPCPAFHTDTDEGRRARDIAARHFDELANLKLKPFAYCFRDENRHRIDSVVAEMLGLDPEDDAIQDMLAHYRLLFASEPNVNGRNKAIVNALEEYRSD